jgi:hypothetical protein
VTGEKLWRKAVRCEQPLPLIFSHFVDLTFLAIATSVNVSGDRTFVTFEHLQPILGRERRDLIVVSTGNELPDQFIKSYAIVIIPRFIVNP